MLKDELSDILNKYFEKISEQNVNGFYELLKGFSVKQAEYGIVKMLQKIGKADIKDFQKNYKNYIFTKTITQNASPFDYPNAETAYFIEELLFSLEYTVQAAIKNPETSMSRIDKSKYESVSKYDAERFCKISKTFDLLPNGRIKIKEEVKNDFINCIDKLIHDFYWLKLEKPLYDKIKNDVPRHFYLALTNSLWGRHQFFYEDWVKSLFIDTDALNRLLCAYIGNHLCEDYKTQIDDITNRILDARNAVKSQKAQEEEGNNKTQNAA